MNDYDENTTPTTGKDQSGVEGRGAGDRRAAGGGGGVTVIRSYPRYRNSGEQWLGKIPEHWKVVNSRRIFRERKQRAMAGELQLTASQKYGVISQAEFMSREGRAVMQVIKGHEILKHVEAGDFVISMRSFQGGLELSAQSGAISSAYVPLYPLKWVVPEYFRFLLKSVPFIQALQSTSDLIRDGQALRFENLAKISLPIPSESEQANTAKILDRETARIDTLIEKKTRFIELLKEKRQALITQAVTKGLDPTVPMKDSGVAWIGEVPAHWETTPLRYLGMCQNGLNIGGHAFGKGYPFVSYGDVYKNTVLPESVDSLVQSSKTDRVAYSVRRGDVFFTRTSETIEEIGFTATCYATIEDATFAGFLIRFRPTPGLLNLGYSKHYFSGQMLRAFFVREMNLITRASLSQELLKKMVVTLPPLGEQNSIAAWLDEQTEKFDAISERIATSITLLKERRSALITAAVTGQIDLREEE